MERKKGELYLFLSFLERNGEVIGKIQKEGLPTAHYSWDTGYDPLQLNTISLLGRGQVAEQE